MIKQEETILGGNTFLHTYSDSNFYIEQIETGSIYDETYDVIPCKFTYRETDKLIEKEEGEYYGN